MNLVVTCTECGNTLRVFQRLDVSEDVETLVGTRSKYWPDKYQCPRCGGTAVGCDEKDAPTAIMRYAPITDVTATELFAALEGLGIPGELQTDVATVTTLLKEKRIMRVVGKNVAEPARCVLDYLELEDGTRVYLGAGYEGATVYRVSPPASYTTRALQEEAPSGSTL